VHVTTSPRRLLPAPACHATPAPRKGRATFGHPAARGQGGKRGEGRSTASNVSTKFHCSVVGSNTNSRLLLAAPASWSSAEAPAEAE
jgi:hypothetical protein